MRQRRRDDTTATDCAAWSRTFSKLFPDFPNFFLIFPNFFMIFQNFFMIFQTFSKQIHDFPNFFKINSWFSKLFQNKFLISKLFQKNQNFFMIFLIKNNSRFFLIFQTFSRFSKSWVRPSVSTEVSRPTAGLTLGATPPGSCAISASSCETTPSSADLT